MYDVSNLCTNRLGTERHASSQDWLQPERIQLLDSSTAHETIYQGLFSCNSNDRRRMEISQIYQNKNLCLILRKRHLLSPVSIAIMRKPFSSDRWDTTFSISYDRCDRWTFKFLSDRTDRSDYIYYIWFREIRSAQKDLIFRTKLGRTFESWIFRWVHYVSCAKQTSVLNRE